MPCNYFNGCNWKGYICPICGQCVLSAEQTAIVRKNARGREGADSNSLYGHCPGHLGVDAPIGGLKQEQKPRRLETRTFAPGVLTDAQRRMVAKYSGKTMQAACRDEWPTESEEIARKQRREATLASRNNY